MTLKDLIPNRKLRVGLKLAVMGLFLFALDFVIWYIADRFRFKYESVAFTGIFLILMGVSCYKVEKGQTLADASVTTILLAFFIGTTTVALVIAMLFAIPVLIFPNWFGLVGTVLLSAWLGKTRRHSSQRGNHA